MSSYPILSYPPLPPHRPLCHAGFFLNVFLFLCIYFLSVSVLSCSLLCLKVRLRIVLLFCPLCVSFSFIDPSSLLLRFPFLWILVLPP